MEWHPDNFHGEQQKVAQKKFIDIAAAKEVLTDPGICEQINFFLLTLNYCITQKYLFIASRFF